LSLTRGYFLVVPQFEICENAGKLGRREHKMGEYTDRVRADIVSDNRARRILYVVYGALAVTAVCLLGGFATIVLVLGLGPVLMLIVVIEIYSRIQNWRRLRAAADADAELAQVRPEKSNEAMPVNVIRKLRGRAQQAQNAGEPYLAADLRLAATTIERLDRNT
jgi:hypothetical protein